jgi:Zn-dependent protease
MLALSVSIFYFLYQMILIFSATTGREDSCMFEFWIPHQEWWKNPFWLVVTIVSGLLALSMFLAVEGVARRRKTKIATGSLSFAILVIWLYGLGGLWDAMLFEKGEISAEAWYQNERGAFGLALLKEEYVCRPAT